MMLETLDLIVRLEGKLKAAINLQQRADQSWKLSLKLVYDGEPAGNLSFNLDGYDRDEAWKVARSIPTNAFLMREIDAYLSGESE